MKNIFSILLIMAMAMSFTACGGDSRSYTEPEPEPEDPHQQVENPIEGTWIRENGEWKVIYTADFREIAYRRIGAVDDENSYWEKDSDWEYKINKTSFYYIDHAGVLYYKTESCDTLYVGRSRDKVNIKYIRMKEESED